MKPVNVLNKERLRFALFKRFSTQGTGMAKDLASVS